MIIMTVKAIMEKEGNNFNIQLLGMLEKLWMYMKGIVIMLMLKE